MVIFWFIAIVAVIIIIVAFAAFLASRKRTSSHPETFQFQDRKTPADSTSDGFKQDDAQTTAPDSQVTVPPLYGATKGVSEPDESTQLGTSDVQEIDDKSHIPVIDGPADSVDEILTAEEPGIRVESSGAGQGLTTEVDLRPQKDNRTELNIENAKIKDKCKNTKDPEQKELSKSATKDSSVDNKYEERPDEIEISSPALDETPTSEPTTEPQADQPSIDDDDEPVSAKKIVTTERKHPPKYKPSLRTPKTTIRNKSKRTEEAPESQISSLSMYIHVVFGLRSRCQVSLLPTRCSYLSEEIVVEGPNGPETWNAYQDEWYSEILPQNIGNLLEQGGSWKSFDGQVRWSLSGRNIYVFAPSPTISGFVSTTRLILGEDHLVLCTNLQKESVREALVQVGCAEPTEISQEKNVPTNWVVFRHVRPKVPIQHDEEAGIYNILRPLHNLEIIMTGGIRLSHFTWLNGHPPSIHIRGVGADVPEVFIDRKIALADANGIYTVSGWDEPGHHTVFAGGVTQSYELGDGVQEWQTFDAFEYKPNPEENVDRSIKICGPLVIPSSEKEFTSLTPSTNNCFLGAIPGQVMFSAKPRNVRSPEFLAVADFPIIWTLPLNPLGCDRSLADVKLIQHRTVILGHKWALHSNREAVLQWCYKILEASYKRLKISPDTVESRQLWVEYKRAAHGLRRQLR